MPGMRAVPGEIHVNRLWHYHRPGHRYSWNSDVGENKVEQPKVDEAVMEEHEEDKNLVEEPELDKDVASELDSESQIIPSTALLPVRME